MQSDFLTTIAPPPAVPALTTVQRIQKIGSNRGVPRIWIEGQALLAMGWNHGDHYTCEFRPGSVTYAKHDSGSRTIAGNAKRPIIADASPSCYADDSLWELRIYDQ